MSRALSTVRYASAQTGVNFEKILTWVAIAGIAFIAYKAWTVGSAIKGALNSVGSALGTGLYEIFHPDVLGETVFFTVQFPDGARHAIASGTVDGAGKFTYQGARYQMMVDRGQARGINKYAVPL